MTIVLENAGYRAELRPKEGGLIASLQSRGARGWIDLLLAEPPGGGSLNGMAHFGCFPMVPFVNRLPQAWLPLGWGRAEFARNWPLEGIAHHGTGWQTVWSCERTGAASAMLETAIHDANDGQLGVAGQDIRLDANGLSVRLHYRHGHAEPMPAGVGLHPWFHSADGQDEASFMAGGEYVMGTTHLCEGHHDKPGERRFSHADTGFNGCFSGWDGMARITRPAEGIVVNMTGDCDLLHAYVATAFQAFCLEPVTHFPGAAHAGLAAPGQMRVLNRGNEISTTLRIWAKHGG